MLGQTQSARANHRIRKAVLITGLWFAASANVAWADESSPAAGAPAAAGSPASPSGQSSAAPDPAHIQQLIRDLGNPRYTTRRAAAAELRQIGPESFDLLHAATEDTDPEIAASANYLLRQIAVRWVRPNDPAPVRNILSRYGQDAESQRLQHIDRLASFPQGAGAAALCRIARFDRSALVSRAAALAIIRPKNAERNRPDVDPALVEQELGPSTRASVKWLRQYLVQLHDPPASIATWNQLVDDEQARLKHNKSESSDETMLGLLWNLADVYRQAGMQEPLSATIDKMMELNLEGFDQTAISLIEWLVDTKSWNALDTFLTKHQNRFQQSKLPLYFAAIARAKQGKTDEAEKLAKEASEIPPQSSERLIAAVELEQRGHFEWAIREYRASIDKEKKNVIDSQESILASVRLANLLFDHERHKEAAEVLAPLVKSVQNQGRAGQIYAGMQDRYRELLDPDKIAARFHFYRAEQYLADKERDLKRAQGELDLAINFDPEDADVLITMYRFPEAEQKWRDSVRQKIRKLADDMQQKIDQDPSEATNYNQWAWLISNTEGDFQKAVRYSHRSLELNTNGESGESSYLDTLARCYFAAGDFEKAVQYERQAIEKNAHLQVMHRQLKEFEQALEKKKAGK